MIVQTRVVLSSLSHTNTLPDLRLGLSFSFLNHIVPFQLHLSTLSLSFDQCLPGSRSFLSPHFSTVPGILSSLRLSLSSLLDDGFGADSGHLARINRPKRPKE